MKRYQVSYRADGLRSESIVSCDEFDTFGDWLVAIQYGDDGEIVEVARWPKDRIYQVLLMDEPDGALAAREAKS